MECTGFPLQRLPRRFHIDNPPQSPFAKGDLYLPSGIHFDATKICGQAPCRNT